MYELRKTGKEFMSKSVGTGPSSYGNRIYRTVVSQRLGNTELETSISNSNTLILTLTIIDIMK